MVLFRLVLKINTCKSTGYLEPNLAVFLKTLLPNFEYSIKKNYRWGPRDPRNCLAPCYHDHSLYQPRYISSIFI